MSAVKAINLTAEHLGRWISGSNYKGIPFHGRLDSIELHHDTRHRVVIRVATLQPTETGATYWSTFSAEQYVSPDALLSPGGPA